jgi:hypothetical protein
MAAPTFPLTINEADFLSMYGLDDYICCYDGTSRPGEEPWRELVITGAKALADKLEIALKARDEAACTLEGDEILWAFEAFSSMRTDSPLDGCRKETREWAYALIDRLEAVARPLLDARLATVELASPSRW